MDLARAIGSKLLTNNNILEKIKTELERGFENEIPALKKQVLEHIKAIATSEQ